MTSIQSYTNRPKLIITVGPPGSGKTTYAHKYIKENPGTVHLSSDGIRKELHGDESIQDNPGEVFAIMQKRAIDGLNFGYDVIYDATNVARKDRTSIIAACPKFANIQCHIIWAPIETCIERDAARERTVGKAVIDKMLKRFQPVWYDEGIHEIKIIEPECFDVGAYARNVIEAMKIPHDNPHHSHSVYDHCAAAVAIAANNAMGRDLECAAFIHDCGKPYVKTFKEVKATQATLLIFILTITSDLGLPMV